METERLIIDRIKDSDKVDYFTNISHDKKVLETFVCRYAETLDEFDFSSYLGRDDLFAIRLKDSGKLIGIILYFDEKGGECEIGYGIGSAYWNNGYVTESVRRFLQYLFDEKGINKVYASFFTGNDASRRVMEKCGMKYDHFNAKEFEYLGVPRDLTYFAINKDERLKMFADCTYIVAGDEMLKLMSKKHPEIKAIPFRENFAVGTYDGYIFNDKFIKRRAEGFGATVDNYKEKLAPIINLDFSKKYVLCFGECECCKANLKFLTNYLLACGYAHPIKVLIVDELTLETIREHCISFKKMETDAEISMTMEKL